MDRLQAGFLKSLRLIADYLPQVVIAGGWAPFVYYHYLLGDKSKNPLRTGDIDIVVANRLPLIGSMPIDETLKDAGLRPVFKTRTQPPVIHYEGKIDGCEVEIEFLTDLRGSCRDEVIEVQEGVHAEALRYLTILLENVIEVKIDDAPGIGQGATLAVRLPSPGAFVLNKGLVFPRRRERSKKGKDLYYIFDLITYREDFRDRIVSELIGLRERYKPWFKTLKENLGKAFGGIGSEAVSLTKEQRPAGAFRALTDSQLEQYILLTFQEFLSSFP